MGYVHVFVILIYAYICSLNALFENSYYPILVHHFTHTLGTTATITPQNLSAQYKYIRESMEVRWIGRAYPLRTHYFSTHGSSLFTFTSSLVFLVLSLGTLPLKNASIIYVLRTFVTTLSRPLCGFVELLLLLLLVSF